MPYSGVRWLVARGVPPIMFLPIPYYHSIQMPDDNVVASLDESRWPSWVNEWIAGRWSFAELGWVL